MKMLEELIIEMIRKKGRISFAEFMETALYHPLYGYYHSQQERVGRYGDYYTSPTVHKVFGELMAKQMKEMWEIMGRGLFTIVELGANRGWLCYDIIQCVKHEYPIFYDCMNYIIIESNPFIKERLMSLFDSDTFDEGKVSFHKLSGEGFSFDSIDGCFLSNEFFDALPVHRFVAKKGVLKEIFVGYNGCKFIEIVDDVSLHTVFHYIETHQINIYEGQNFEFNEKAAEWLAHIAKKLKKGFVVSLDYGDVRERLYTGERLEGTVRCFYKHTVNRNYYERIGEQDITAYVDFSHLINSGISAGLEKTGITKQSHFLIALGILKKISMDSNDIDTVLKIKNLIHPEGMGEIFKVLIQHKNLVKPGLEGLTPLQSIKL